MPATKIVAYSRMPLAQARPPASATFGNMSMLILVAARAADRVYA
jgi:hypothetical protein